MAYDRFGPYTVHECLGAGGMAIVHRATLDIGDGIIREVALKRLLPQLAGDKKFVEDFVREAKLAAQLHHPGIVRILELGRQGSTYFIAMELVSGQSLLQLMKLALAAGTQAPIGIVVAVLCELCDALDYASNATDSEGEPLHIVHRDLSPSNLIVTAEGHLKIIDFGVAKAMSGKFMTSSGAVKGKFGYMSIEALSGKPVDRRADIFSVGVVAWELIAAQRLFRATNDYEVITMIHKGASTPPSRHNRQCPPELDEIVMRALARDREERWPNAAVMRRTLDSLRRTYREGPAEIVAWMQSLAPRPSPELTVELSRFDLEPPSIVIEESASIVIEPDLILDEDVISVGFDAPPDPWGTLESGELAAFAPEPTHAPDVPTAPFAPALAALAHDTYSVDLSVDVAPPTLPVPRLAPDDLAEGTKRRASASRPPSTLAKRARVKADTLVDADEADVEATSVSGLAYED